ncbi:CoA transferase [Streptomyces sp. PSRA5]|uniref:CoA transferase n=1 Tax=Streptomyces panacea TaxID=3035064 RepID=UPI00339BAF38
MAQHIDAATAHAWSALGGAPESAGLVTYVPAPGVLPSRLPVRQLARASVGVCSLAAAELVARRSGRRMPGVLPAQALDHSTGYLLAAAILRALTERQRDGAGRHLRLSLAGTASWLTHDIRPEPTSEGAEPNDPGPWMAGTPSPYGQLRYVRSPVEYEGGPGDWAGPPSMWGTDAARWL